MISDQKPKQKCLVCKYFVYLLFNIDRQIVTENEILKVCFGFIVTTKTKETLWSQVGF